MKKVGICGHFGVGLDLTNGQTIKTKIVTAELERQLGAEEIELVDSHGGIGALPRMLVQTFKLFKDCENIVMLPAYKGLRVFAPIFSLYNRFFHRKVHYVVIGGWLDSFMDQHQWLAGLLKKISGIYVETTTMKAALEKKNFDNVVVMPNFKNLDILPANQLVFAQEEPYRLCTFSRVMAEKGIEDAIQAVAEINESAHRLVYTLDIYGPVSKEYTERFLSVQQNFPVGVAYQGVVPFDGSVDVLKNYYALLFPTKFYTEGIPGTIIDSYAAGVPVIASKWESFSDVIVPGETGIGFEFGNTRDLTGLLEQLSYHPESLNKMKTKCLEKANDYMPEQGIKPLLNRIKEFAE